MAGDDEGETPTTEQPETATWADERERRRRALRELALRRTTEDAASVTAAPGTGTSTATKHSLSLRPPRRARGNAWLQPWWRAGLIVAVLVAIVAALGIRLLHAPVTARVTQTQTPTPPHMITSPLSISLPLATIDCIAPPAWSPDEKTIAALGYVGGCASNDPVTYAYRPGLVNIYSAQTGALLSSLHPDPAIAAALHLTAPQLPSKGVDTSHRGDTSHQIITYDRVLWSPGGSRLALLFSVDYFFNVQVQADGSVQYNTASWYGAATMTLTGTAPLVVGGPAPTFGANAMPPLPWEYDLARSRSVPLPALATTTPGTPGNALQNSFATAYSWNPEGTLTTPQTLMSNTVPITPPLGPVGNPDGDASFTIWQEGSIAPDQQYGPGVYQFSWQLAAWSPDGRYLIPRQSNFGRGFGELLVPAKYGPDPAALALNISSAEPFLPLRDAGLQTMLQQGVTGTVAWSYDGQRLVVIPEHASDGIFNLADLRMYDCASGAEVARFTGAVASGTPVYQPTIVWSPDGKQLLVHAQTGPAGATLFIWRVA